MFDVVLGIAMLIAIIWWFGRDTSPPRPPAPKSPPAPPPATSSGTAPRVDPAARPPEATRGDDAFVDGLIIGAYWYGRWGRDADDGSADPLPGLGDDGLAGEEELEDGDDWPYDPAGYGYGAEEDAGEDEALEDDFEDGLGGFGGPFGFEDDLDF